MDMTLVPIHAIFSMSTRTYKLGTMIISLFFLNNHMACGVLVP